MKNNNILDNLPTDTPKNTTFRNTGGAASSALFGLLILSSPHINDMIKGVVKEYTIIYYSILFVLFIGLPVKIFTQNKN